MMKTPVDHSTKKDWYTVHRIPKRSGGFRILEEPADWLKETQQDILRNILSQYGANDCCFGGVKGRNIADATMIHVRSPVKLKMDISDFFPSVTYDMVINSLIKHDNMPLDEAEKIAFLCTNNKGALPQGACTSPYLANLAADKMCAALDHISDRMGLKFTIYVDDLIFSGDEPEKIIPIVMDVCKRYGFTIKKKKTAILKYKQEVLGLCVTPDLPHPRLNKPTRRRLRGLLFSIKKKLENNEEVSNADINHALGLASFANMVRDQHAERFMEMSSDIRLLRRERC